MIYMGTHLFSGVDSFKSHCCEDQVCYEGGGEVKEACKQVNMDRRMLDCLTPVLCSRVVMFRSFRLLVRYSELRVRSFCSHGSAISTIAL